VSTVRQRTFSILGRMLPSLAGRFLLFLNKEKNFYEFIKKIYKK